MILKHLVSFSEDDHMNTINFFLKPLSFSLFPGSQDDKHNLDIKKTLQI